MSPLKRSALVVALAGALAVPVVARAPITIRLASVTPVNSSWHKALLDMGAEWNTKTAGRVKLTVYAGGTQGDEAAVILEPSDLENARRRDFRGRPLRGRGHPRP